MLIDDLPSEALVRIFRELHPRDWLKSERVCRNWSSIFSSRFWNSIEEIEYESFGYVRLNLDDDKKRSYRLTCSDGDWYDDDKLMKIVLKKSGDRLEKLILRIPRESTLSEETILSTGRFCPRLKSLSLNGNVSSTAATIATLCREFLPDLERIYIWDESFPEDTRNFQDANASILVDDILATCRRLRSIDVNFVFIPPPPVESWRRLSILENVERIRWLFWRPISPDYVEQFLADVVGCRGTLRELALHCELKGPLNGERCADYLKQLSEGDRLERLDLGFQLHVAVHEENPDEVYYDSVESAPWTKEIISTLNLFRNLRHLTLRYFEFDDDDTLDALKNVCKHLRVLRLEDNYGVTGKLTWALRGYSRELRAVTINQARLSHADLVELILACPKLTSLCVSNVCQMSFKKLVLETHAALHDCGTVRFRKKIDTDVDADADTKEGRTLNLELGTACNYIHDEADELKNLHLCGLHLLPPAHSNVFIDKVCQKSGESRLIN